MRQQRDVEAFMTKFGFKVPARPTVPDDRSMTLRVRLLASEFGELVHALEDGDLVGVADGVADLMYVALGTASACGIDMEAVWDEVHRTNMLKKPSSTEKGTDKTGWEPPDIASILAAQHGRPDA